MMTETEILRRGLQDIREGNIASKEDVREAFLSGDADG